MAVHKASHSSKTVHFGDSLSQITNQQFVKLTEAKVSWLQGKWSNTVLFYFKSLGTVIKHYQFLL